MARFTPDFSDSTTQPTRERLHQHQYILLCMALLRSKVNFGMIKCRVHFWCSPAHRGGRFATMRRVCVRARVLAGAPGAAITASGCEHRLPPVPLHPPASTPANLPIAEFRHPPRDPRQSDNVWRWKQER
eukprot:scaffold925_cov133-Isochrysis_galbana.AAC.2